MSALFISHSSADNAAAADLVAFLASRGHRSVFLDFHPEDGIPAGRHWEQELYAQLRGCQALIVLCSAQSMASTWCFAEVTHARALGKPVFPLRIGEGTVSPLLGDVQIVDLRSNRDEGYARLAAGLGAAGLDPAGLFDWDGSRAPYPGLLAFEKADAAVYFGRDAAIQTTRETLNRLQRLGGARLVLLLGASGSGKSSLMRAGVVPRLQREHGRWLVADPFRPQSRPFDALAMALAGLSRSGDWKAIRSTLRAAGGEGPWRDLFNDLLRDAGCPEATLLVVIDQFEELLGRVQDEEATAFMRLLRAWAVAADAPLLCVATLRSDFLGALQTEAALQGLVHEPIMLAPIGLSELAQVVEGPARVAGLHLEPGLAGAMVADTAAEDALPLLAFALRELWDRYGSSGSLRLEHYRMLGGLQGGLARAAEALCGEGKLEAAQIDLLRKALLRLVRVDAEGRFARRPRYWSELPPEVHPLLERFVQARLLVSRGEQDGTRVIEVAHEALFRSWDRLVVWLNADRDYLLWRERLRAAGAEWRRVGRDASLVLRGPLLEEARRWQSERGEDLDADAREFIAASIAALESERATQKQRGRRQAIFATGAALVIGVLIVVATMLWRQWERESRLALARKLMADANEVSADDYLRRLSLSLHSMRQAWTAEGHEALLRGVGMLARPLPATWKPHSGPVRAMALSPDGRWLATAGPGRLQVQAAGGAAYDLHSRNGHHYLQALAFSPDGQWLAASCDHREVCLYDLRHIEAGQPLRRWQREDAVVSAVAFSADGKWLATSGFTSPTVRIHPVGDEAEHAPIATGLERVGAIGFSPDGQRVAVVGEGSELWQFGLGERRKLSANSEAKGLALAFSPDGRLLAVGGMQGSPLRLLHVHGDETGDSPVPGPLSGTWQVAWGGQFGRVGFSTDGLYVANSDDRFGVRVWQVSDGRLVAQALQPAGSLAFDRGRLVISGGMDGRIIEWDPDGQALHRLASADEVTAVALSPDSRWLVSLSKDGRLRIYGVADGKELPSLAIGDDVARLAFSRDGRWLAGFGGASLWLVEVAGWRTVGPLVHDRQVLGVAFDAEGKRVATSSQWDGFRVWVERMNAARQLRVWDIASRSEMGRTFAIARHPRADEAAVEAPRTPDEIAAIGQIAAGDEALASAAMSWSAAAGAGDVPAQPWLTTRTAKGDPLSDVAIEVARLSHGSNQIVAAFSADGRLLASASGREVRLWHLKPDDLLAEVCARLQMTEIPVGACPR